MGYYNPDAYNQPEAFGLIIVGELNDPDACYSFDDLVVWQHVESGVVYYAVDSGCSCPSPFEDFTSLDTLTQVTAETWDSFEKAVKEHAVYSWREPTVDENAVRKVELLRRISKLVF